MILRRRAVLCFAAVFCGAFVLALAFPQPACALPANEVENAYYSDEALTQWVGSEFLFCNGGRGSVGIQGEYRVQYQERCPSSNTTYANCFMWDAYTGTGEWIGISCPESICSASNVYCQDP